MRPSFDDLRICLLTTQELDTTPFPDDDWPCDPRPFLPEASWHLETLEGKQGCLPTVRRLVADGGFDLFFNLCDGAADQPDLPGIEVVRVLERACVPFVGAVSACYEPARRRMRQVCRRLGIAAPKAMEVATEADIDRAAATLSFPLFVKHHSSYASVDISRRSRVCSPAGLRIQARKIISRHGAALVEQFIEGDECTVLVVENPEDPTTPIAYPPVQYRFPPGERFKHEDLKWVDFDGMTCDPVSSGPLRDRLQEECSRFFAALDGASFGRCDLRIDVDGTPYMLELNANCGVFYPPSAYGGADLCIVNHPGGHEAFTRTLVEAAFSRHARRMRSGNR